MKLSTTKEVLSACKSLVCGVCKCSPTVDQAADLCERILRMPKKFRSSVEDLSWFCPDHKAEGRRILEAAGAKPVS
jgi:hypothetical protein